jgi:hypothetical protein
MSFKASFCDPLMPDIIELGEINEGEIVGKFNSYDWSELLGKMTGAKDGEVFYSPSFEVEDIDNNHSLSISAIGEPGEYEFAIFYKRPKNGQSEYLSDIDEQTKDDAIKCLHALVARDFVFLDDKIGG